jgi:Family of unknown function (DUF5681)
MAGLSQQSLQNAKTADWLVETEGIETGCLPPSHRTSLGYLVRNGTGRPKKCALTLDPGELLQSIDNEEIIIKIDGKQKRMTKAEIQFRQLFTKGIKGDLTAQRLVANMAYEYSAPEERGNYGLEVIGKTEAAQRFGRAWQRHIEEHNARLRGWR